MTISAKVYEVFENAQGIINSVSTGAMSPNEVIDSLKRLGMESHVTEAGDLMIRCWQIAAENFVSPEQAAIIRQGRSLPEQGDKLDWLSSNLQDIRREYGGQWVAVYGNEIVASALNLSDLMSLISEFDKPLVTFIPSEPVIWNFTYAL